MSITGMVFDIQRFCIHDGPGIRTTVFLKGCPLQCLWCHNPESQSFVKQIAYCKNLGTSKYIGEEKSVNDILDIVKKDIPYYLHSGGGMTISGGEPLSQPDFSYALLKGVKLLGIHTCVETSGFCKKEWLEKILPYTDLFLFDYKETNPLKHKEFTGVDNTNILTNLDFLYAAGVKIVLRCPIIPDMNDTSEHFHGIAALSEKYPGFQSIEIMPYHDLGKNKAAQVGMDYVVSAKSVSEEQKQHWVDNLKALGVRNAV